MQEKLNSTFIEEMLKACFMSRSMFDVCKDHIQYHFFENEAHKLVWKEMILYYTSTNDLPTLGYISQKFVNDRNSSNAKRLEAALEVVNRVKGIPRPKDDDILKQLEIFVKRSLFMALATSMEELFNTNQPDKAYKLLQEESDKINGFSLKSDYIKPFIKSFEERNVKRMIDKLHGKNPVKLSSGIPDLDYYTAGWMEEGDTALVLAGSGVGKTTLLRWFGLTGLRLGFNVLHISAEESQEKLERVYDSTWTGLDLDVIDDCDFDDAKWEEIRRAMDGVEGELYLRSYETFGAVSLKDVREDIVAMTKRCKIDLVLLDYFELFEPGDGKKYVTSAEGEKARRQAIGKGIKNIAIEQKTRILAATQSSDVPPDKLNDPNFKLTRSHISGDRNAINPFSFFITINQTMDEYDKGIIRIFIDKLRYSKAKQIIRICTSYPKRFYDHIKTVKSGMISDKTKDKILK